MLSSPHLAGLEQRGIDPELATRMGIFTGQRSDGDIVPDLSGPMLCFPYYEGDEIIQVKARWRKNGARQFEQIAGRQKTFYNANSLRDPHYFAELQAGTMALLITEGEFDCLAGLMAGHYTAVSVPNGAPPARDASGKLIEVPKDSKDLDPEEDDAFSYIGRNMDWLAEVKQFIIATDADEAGQRLAKELVRRLGAARCSWVEYPKDPCIPDPKTGELRACKDLNEVLMHFGIEGVQKVLNAKREWPVSGLFGFSDFPEPGELEIVTTGLSDELDVLLKPYPGAFMVVTGVPNTGKSEVVKQIAVNLAKRYGWHTAMFPGEEMVKPFLERSLKTKVLRKHYTEWTPEESRYGDEFLARHFQIIAHDPRFDEEDITLDKLLELAAASVFRHGTKVLIIDPWNEIEHERDSRISLTEYVGAAIRKIKRFARTFGVLVIVVAHPKKVESQPTLYDISDSAHWYNKADLALIIDTDEPLGVIRDFLVCKIRFQGVTGEKGKCKLQFNKRLQFYEELASLDRPRLAA